MLAKHHADDAELLVQKAIIEIGQKYDIPMVVLRGVRTYEFIGKYHSSKPITVEPTPSEIKRQVLGFFALKYHKKSP